MSKCEDCRHWKRFEKDPYWGKCKKRPARLVAKAAGRSLLLTDELPRKTDLLTAFYFSDCDVFEAKKAHEIEAVRKKLVAAMKEPLWGNPSEEKEKKVMLETLRACRDQAELCCGNCISWRMNPRASEGYCKVHGSMWLPDEYCSRGQRRPVEVKPTESNFGRFVLDESIPDDSMMMRGRERS